jgi:choice-of-anchor A domain-containing protein
VTQTLRDAQDRVYDTRTVDFTVASSSDTGTGLRGTLSAHPREGEVDTAIRFNATVTNGGNADLIDVPLKVMVLDVAGSTVVWSRETQHSIARDAQVDFMETWSTVGAQPGDYTAVLIATVGGRSLTLARDDVRLTASTRCIEVRLSDYNLFVLEDYTGGHDVEGKVAAGGNITMTDFAVGARLGAIQISNTLVADGNLALSRGGVWGDAWYGGSYSADTTVVFPRGSVAQGRPISFATRASELRTLSSRLASLQVNGSTTRESWGGVMMRGTDPVLNVFNVSGSDFTGAVFWSIDAPAGSLVVVNIRGTAASFSGFSIAFSGGIGPQGVLYNFVDATHITAQGIGFVGTLLAPYAHVDFNNGSWDGGLYAKSLTGNAEGHIHPLNDRDICR